MEETIERLQIVATQDGRIAHPITIGIFGRGSLLHLFDNILWHFVHDGKEGKDKGVFVVVAHRSVEHQMKYSVATHLVQRRGNVGMLVIEGHKPIGDIVEEGIALHVLETLEEKVHALTALVHITAHARLYLFHLLLGGTAT